MATPTTPVTPATAGITAIPDPKRSPQSYQAYLDSQAAKANQSFLDKSNAQIQSSYQPILDFYAKQQQTTQDRYAQNAANLKNIFGALTGISDKDKATINKQFESSVLKQQQDLAARTAEQRAAQAAGTAQAAVTGAERGNGPALQGSPTATATEQGIGQSNAIQQNWEGLMGAQQANAITDVTNRGAGYGQQEVAANTQLSQNLQDALAAIGGQTAGIDSQIAQAKMARDQAIASNDFQAAQQAADLANKLAVAKTAASARIGAAQITAAAKKSSGGTAKKTTYTKDLTGTLQRVGDTYGTGTAAEFQTQLDNIQAGRPKDATAAYNAWIKKFGPRVSGLPQAAQVDLKATAKNYFNSITYPKATSTSSTPRW